MTKKTEEEKVSEPVGFLSLSVPRAARPGVPYGAHTKKAINTAYQLIQLLSTAVSHNHEVKVYVSEPVR